MNDRGDRIWTSRRLWFAITSFWTIAVLVWFGKIDTGTFGLVAGSIVGGYFLNRTAVDGFGK